MQIEQLLKILDDRDSASQWLHPLRIRDLDRAHENLVGIARTGLTLDLMCVLCTQLTEQLPLQSDPDRALNNLERFFRESRNCLGLGSLIERDSDALPILLQLFSNTQYLSDVLIQEPEGYDLLRITEGQPVSRKLLVEEITREVTAVQEERQVMSLLRHYKRRETLRIAYGDLIRGQGIETVTRQISILADAICSAALTTVTANLQSRYGMPRRSDGQPARFAVLSLGKLGGNELNYSSDIDLMFLYDEDGKTDGEKSIHNGEYFDRVARGMVNMLTEATEMGSLYRVDLRLRPEGSHGAMVISSDAAKHYYDIRGRTWERQAFVKGRPTAGCLEFGKEFLTELEPWIYRRYLSRADISGIKALKRRIEQRAKTSGADRRDVKTGHGGIRDIEFVIQFLQLLNGGDLPAIRTGNTLDAIVRLEQAGCLTMQERTILEENYTFLRRIEHCLQIMFDLQTHAMPEDENEMRKLALRMGYGDTARGEVVLDAFREDFHRRTELNRKILDHLLHDAFGEDDEAKPEVDLVLDPEPSPGMVEQVLSEHGFRDVQNAYRNLMELATEKIPFLSPRRCRHFLAAIAPKLLKAISKTPEPDATLISLSQVSDSLGGKGVLWELFSSSEASLDLYVRLCAACPYLSAILTSNPGMLDELMDSLVLDRLPTLDSLRTLLDDLCRGAEDIEPILHSFKNSLHLRVGVRDVLGKAEIKDTTAALSDIAEACLERVTQDQYRRLVAKIGEPRKAGARAESGDESTPCELVILALGKFGGREPNYHSDLDLVFVYEADGATRHGSTRGRGETTTNQHFFSELGQRIIKFITRLGPQGRLYELDARLRPSGRSGSLAVSLDEFKKYFADGPAELWERQALCRARAVFGSEQARTTVMQAVRQATIGAGWSTDHAAAIRHMRGRLEETASPWNLKRGKGGTVDVDFAVQMMQLRFGAKSSAVLVPGTTDALAALHEFGHIAQDDLQCLTNAYVFLRSVEARLRLMNTTARHDMPQDQNDLAKLAYLLDRGDADSLVRECQQSREATRQCFDRLFDDAQRGC